MLALYLSMLETPEEKVKFEQIYYKYRQDMYAVAFDILKNNADAEDAVQEAFFKIANNFTKISQRSGQEIKPYVVIVCRNTALDMYRVNRRIRENNFSIDQYEQQYEIPDKTDLEAADHELLRSAIKGLPQIYMDVIYLYDYIGFSTKEVAELLSVSVNVVYKRVERGRQKLKTILQEGEVRVE